MRGCDKRFPGGSPSAREPWHEWVASLVHVERRQLRTDEPRDLMIPALE
jgi:hypothetical protein